MEDAFRLYAPYYDLLNREKPYQEEAEYVAERLLGKSRRVETILELGSGTGVHGRLLAQKGFLVHGIERSADMVSVALGRRRPTSGDFQCECGDIRDARLGRSFDAVISLFHVVSYMTSKRDIGAVFQTAHDHLKAGGLFLFDVWHGPAVLAVGPSARERVAEDGELRVVRRATPSLLEAEKVVVVDFDFLCTNSVTGENFQFSEEHRMRYFFPEEIETEASRRSFKIVGAEELVTGKAPSTGTWAVTYLLEKS